MDGRLSECRCTGFLDTSRQTIATRKSAVSPVGGVDPAVSLFRGGRRWSFGRNAAFDLERLQMNAATVAVAVFFSRQLVPTFRDLLVRPPPQTGGAGKVQNRHHRPQNR